MTPPRRVLDAHAARLAAADLLSRRPWTRADLTARLRRRGAPADVTTDVVADLASRGHVDDGAFARDWVAIRTARGYGAARLRMELRARGVAAALIDAALADLGTDGVEDRAREVARRRLPALQRLEAKRASSGRPEGASFGRAERASFGRPGSASSGRADRIAARLRDYLMRRGYSGGIAARVARELTGASRDPDVG